MRNPRAFIVPEGSYISFLRTNIEPIGGCTSAEDKLPLSMTLNGVPRKVLQGTEMVDAFANVTATVEYEQAVTKTIPVTDLTLRVVPDMYSLGNKTIVAVYNKSYKGENCTPVIAYAQFEVVDKMFTSIGATDNSTSFWGAHSEAVKVAPKETVVTTFTNYTNSGGNWNNFVVVLACQDGSTEYGVLRADNWGWGTGWTGEELATKCTPSGGQTDWATWLAAMDEATVTVSVTNNGNGTADIRCVMVGNNGQTYTQDYIGLNTISDPEDLYFHFTVDGTHQISGTYQFLLHKYGLDHRKKELATPVEITLHANGTISGSRTGTWSLTEGTSYITLTINNVIYKGVMVEQTMEPSQTKRVPAFTALANSGVTIWGYRTGDDTSAVHDVTAEKNDTKDAIWYDLKGRRINTPLHKGIYIRNGRKVYYQ